MSSLDILEFVVLCMKHMHVSYNTRVPKVVEGVINDETRGAARMEYGVVGILDSWTMEVGGWVRMCVERGTIDGLFFFELEVYTPLLVQQELAKLLWQNLCVISKGLQQLYDCNTQLMSISKTTCLRQRTVS